jgi:ribose-phosphate pyrophosphokinase
VVSPDVGGVSRARELAERIRADLAIVDKRRSGPGQIESMTVIGDVRDRVCIIVDDMVDSGGTLVKAAELLVSSGAREVHAYITHGVLSGNATEKIAKSVLKSLVVTDSIEPTEAVRKSKNIRIVPTAPMFAQAIMNIANGHSVSNLFSDAALGPIYEAYYPAD